MVICLDDNHERADLDAIRGTRGADFVYSPRYGEWIIACRDLDVKRRVRARYKAGIPIYTLDEIVRISHYPTDMADEMHEMVRVFGAEIE